MSGSVNIIPLKLHWLSVYDRAQFKIGLRIITYQILKHGQPAYLSEPINLYTSSRVTRHIGHKFRFHHIPSFECKLHKSHTHFSKSFRYYAPVQWNSFLLHIRNSPSVTSLRKHLQTHLFNSRFYTQYPSLRSQPQLYITDLDHNQTVPLNKLCVELA